MKGAFQRCKLKCLCGELKVCKATQLKECSVCFDVLKTQCHKKACKNNDGELPEVICVASKKKKTFEKVRKESIIYQSSDESDTEIEIYHENGSDQDYLSEESNHNDGGNGDKKMYPFQPA